MSRKLLVLAAVFLVLGVVVHANKLNDTLEARAKKIVTAMKGYYIYKGTTYKECYVSKYALDLTRLRPTPRPWPLYIAPFPPLLAFCISGSGLFCHIIIDIIWSMIFSMGKSRSWLPTLL